MRRRLKPFYGALSWYCSVMIFGGLVATFAITLPFLGVWWLIYGDAMPAPSWTVLRSLQIAQIAVISSAGGYLAWRYFQRRFDVAYEDVRKPLFVTGLGVPALCVLGVLLISIPRYGGLDKVIVSSMLIFGTFTICFLCGSFHFARKLKRD